MLRTRHSPRCWEQKAPLGCLGEGLWCHAGFLVRLRFGPQSGLWLFWSHSVCFPFPASFRGDGTCRYLPSAIDARRLPNSQSSSVDSAQTFVHSQGPVPRHSLTTCGFFSSLCRSEEESLLGFSAPCWGRGAQDSEVAPRLWWEAHLQAGSSFPTHSLTRLAIAIAI